MMRARIVTTVAVFVSVSAAQAGPMHIDDAWFTLEGTTCTGVDVLFQGPQQALTINKSNDSTCNLTLGYNITGSSGSPFRRLSSYAFQLHNTPDISLVGVDYTPGDALGFTYHFAFNTAGSFVDIGGADPQGIIGSVGGLVARITIQISKPNGGLHLITGNYGSSAQIYVNGELWYGRVGPNQASFGEDTYSPSGWGPLPVVSITNVPEPMTIGLLGLALCLFRRRKKSIRR